MMLIVSSAAAVVGALAYSGYPTFSIHTVVRDETVTIFTSNMPADTTFTVRMGAYGTLGVGGTVVASTYSGSGGAFTATYTIPAGLKGAERIAIRMDSTAGGFFAYNWFWNNTAPGGGSPAPTAIPGYSGYPVFSITGVEKGVSVTISGSNFPPGDTFAVTMNTYGTLGIGGTSVTTVNTGAGGALFGTFNIPAALASLDRIAIRLQSPTTGYYAYNWFWNNTFPATPAPTVVPGPIPTPGPSYSGYPTFYIQSVVKDNTVTIVTNNLPSGDTFTVRMGAYGTLGIGGTAVASTASGTGGVQTLTYTIPDGLKGTSRIAIRMDSPTSGYYAYNWFWNNTSP
jgi:hypothetical protein